MQHTEVTVNIRGRILVTGGGGMLGKVLIRRLLSTGNAIVVLDKIFLPHELNAIRAEYPHGDIEFIQGDIRDPAALDAAFSKKVAGVLNLAAVSRVEWCLENERDCQDVNVQGMEKVLQRFDGSWFIQASSREVYGNAESFPVEEDAPHRPANAYGRSKAMAEAAVYKHMESTDTPTNVVMLRFTNMYGSVLDHKERLIPAIFTNALGSRPIQIMGGAQDLGFVHVHDAANAVLRSVDYLEAKYAEGVRHSVEAFNVVAPGSTSAMTLIRKIMSITNSSSPLQMIPGDNRYPDKYVGSAKKASEVLGFDAEITIDQGLAMLASDYLSLSLAFLRDRSRAMCDSAWRYSKNDLLKLDGCSGTVLREVDGEPTYVTTADGLDEPTGLNASPQIWDFAVKSNFGQVVLNISHAGESHLLKGKVQADTGLFEAHSTSILENSASKSPTSLFRVTSFCCPNQPAPWTFNSEDTLPSAIEDLRMRGKGIVSDSHRRETCDSLARAADYAKSRLQRIQALPQPIILDEEPLPTGNAQQWRLRDTKVCCNMCDHPTICIDTGDCSCALAACIGHQRFPFAAFANLPDLSYPPPLTNWAAIELHNPDMLVDQVDASSWLNVLRPSARRYLSRKPSLPDVHLTRTPDDLTSMRDASPDEYNIIKGEDCFSADSVLERGVKHLSIPYTDDSLVFMPFFSHQDAFHNVDEWIQNALDNHLPSSFKPENMIIPFTSSWGRCNTKRHLQDTKESDRTRESMLLQSASAWQSMGDLDSPCYFIGQDVVIPARTCLQDKLIDRFGSLSRGDLVGSGWSTRNRLICPRSWREPNDAYGLERRLVGGSDLQVIWNSYKMDEDYLETIGDTVFCPVPPGATGWTTRLEDVMYAGCIPVLIGDRTHHPFWDMLEWGSFSVTIQIDELDHLEEILLSYSWEEVGRMQTNLMLVRDAFLYPSEETIETVTRERGPFWYAMQTAAMLQRTKWPVR